MNQEEQFQLPPFIPIFVGLNEHLLKGKLSLRDLGTYYLLHSRCQWHNGIYFGNALTLAACMGGGADTKQIRHSLLKLRNQRYINYREGKGSRGSYNILINKFLPRRGALVGYSLDAFAENSLEQPLYLARSGSGRDTGVSRDGGWTVKAMTLSGSGRDPCPPQEIKNTQEFKSIRILEFKKANYDEVKFSNVSKSVALPEGFEVQALTSTGFEVEYFDDPPVMEKESGSKPPRFVPPPQTGHQAEDLKMRDQ